MFKNHNFLKMKTLKTKITSISILLFFLSVSFTGVSQSSSCNTVELKTQSKEFLKPDFRYDASKTTYLTFLNKKQFKELEVPLYIGEKYKLVFNTAGVPENVDIEVYTKKYEANGRELLFSSRDSEPTDNCYTFEPTKALRRVYIDYLIPPASGEKSSGCVVMTLGYKIKK